MSQWAQSQHDLLPRKGRPWLRAMVGGCRRGPRSHVGEQAQASRGCRVLCRAGAALESSVERHLMQAGQWHQQSAVREQCPTCTITQGSPARFSVGRSPRPWSWCAEVAGLQRASGRRADSTEPTWETLARQLPHREGPRLVYLQSPLFLRHL